MSDSASLTVIPDPSPTRLVPTGWATDVFAPTLLDATWEGLDDAEGRLKGLASMAESYKNDSTEFEKALRIVEARRGLLAGPAVRGKPKANVRRAEHYDDESPATLSMWRKIAAHWETVVWPRLLQATTAAEVSQAAILRLIDQTHGKPSTNGHTPAQKPRPAPRSNGGAESAEEMAAALTRRAEPAPSTNGKHHPPEPPPEESDEPDLLDVLQSTAKDVDRLNALVASLQKDDTAAELVKLSERYARLEGRLNQCMTTEAEAQKDAKYAKGQLAKIRKALKVDSDKAIHEALADLLR